MPRLLLQSPPKLTGKRTSEGGAQRNTHRDAKCNIPHRRSNRRANRHSQSDADAFWRRLSASIRRIPRFVQCHDPSLQNLIRTPVAFSWPKLRGVALFLILRGRTARAMPQGLTPRRLLQTAAASSLATPQAAGR